MIPVLIGVCQCAPQGGRNLEALNVQAHVGSGFQGDSSLAKIVEEQRYVVENGQKFGHAAQQVSRQAESLRKILVVLHLVRIFLPSCLVIAGGRSDHHGTGSKQR